MVTDSAAWLLEAPQDTLTPEFVRRLPKSTLAAIFLSILFSYALAKTLIAHPLQAVSYEMSPAPALFIMHFALQALSVWFGALMMSRVARLATGERSEFAYWFSIGIVALIPVHLVLPLALLVRPLGAFGRILYACGEIALWGVSFRRWAWAAQARYKWPFWKALLVVLSPFLLSGALFVITTAFLVMVICLMALGLIV
jgi:hypothetical protein